MNKLPYEPPTIKTYELEKGITKADVINHARNLKSKKALEELLTCDLVRNNAEIAMSIANIYAETRQKIRDFEEKRAYLDIIRTFGED